MNLKKILKNTFIILVASLVLNACATKKTSTTTSTPESTSTSTSTSSTPTPTPTPSISGQMQGDVFIGMDSVEYLASGVPDRVFFATNEIVLTTASRETLRKQAAWLRENSDINVIVEGHADERGTREYNLALGERRANSAKDYLMTYGVSSDRISVLSYGKEKPVDSGSNPLSWSKNRRSVSVKAN